MKALKPADSTKPIGYLNRKDSANYLSISTRLLDLLASNGELKRSMFGRKPVFSITNLDAAAQARVECQEVANG